MIAIRKLFIVMVLLGVCGLAAATAHAAPSGDLYKKCDSWTETMSTCRVRYLKQVAGNQASKGGPAAGLWKQIAKDFPREARWVKRDAGGGVLRWFDRAPEPTLEKAMIGNLLRQLKVNYDITDKQRKIDALVKSKVPGGDKRWLDLYAAIALEVYGDRLDRPLIRPYSPGPYVEPVTPETRTLTADEARAAMEADWIHQAGNKPSVQRATQEIAWARELATRLAGGKSAPNLRKELAELAALETKLTASKSDARGLYLAVRAVKRRITFKNPLVDFSSVLLVDNPYPQGATGHHESGHRNGIRSRPGGRLLVLDGLHPGGKVRKLAPKAPGSFFRPDLSFDAKKVLFCFMPHNEKAYHLYEMNVDGSGLKQLTFGNYDDLDPIYLPDGHIMFSTVRAHTYVRCLPSSPAFVLARCDADGRNIYIISYNNEPDYLPSLLNDGRVIYSRWEYTDKALWRVQSLWTTNPDGTSVSTFWGNQSVWPDHVTEPRAIPGSKRVMFTGLGHHAWFAGCIGIIDPEKGLNFPDGLTKVTADLAWPESGNGPVDRPESKKYHKAGGYRAYKTPYPLSEEDFLVSANRGGKFRLYLMDVHGNRELIYQGAHHIWYAQPLRPRKRPPVLPDRVAWPGTGKNHTKPKNGVLYSNNVFQGAPDLPKDKVKYLRVIQMDPKTYSTWYKTVQHDGPAVSITQAEGVKRILGTAAIESDGSVCFSIPPGTAVHFQLLDKDYRCIQTMRSFTGVMPGETRGCLGCHELQMPTSGARAGRPSGALGIAMRKGPVKLTQPPWGAAESIGYERFVQPVLDKYCGKCHQGKGKGRKKLDMTLRPSKVRWRWKSRDEPSPFKEPYITLVGGHFGWASVRPRNKHGLPTSIAGCLVVEGYNQRDPKSLDTLKPMTTLSYSSKLIDNAMSGKHNKVKVDAKSLRRLIAWVDANGPYLGDEEIRKIPDPVFFGVDVIPVRPVVATAPRLNRFNIPQKRK
ncbi:MAG: hypothetical protein QGH60_15820 [Phycisphaerae bacterium]|jgi:hypothetical protein|nr:hypothetical protein [Phycisphaerae bacterium]